MPGSSFFRIIRKQGIYSVTGPTGPTGATGPIGPTGYGPTGATGPGISFIGLSFGKLYMQFTNGLGITTENNLRGPDGNTVTRIKTQILGNGTSIISSQPTENEIIFRSIKGSSSPSGRSSIEITDNGNTLTFNYTSSGAGATFVNLGLDASNAFIGITSGLSLTNIRRSSYDKTNASVTFNVKNVIEKARGLGFSGATSATSGVTCNYSYSGAIDTYYSGRIIQIDPSCKSNSVVDYGTTNKTYFIDADNNFVKFIIGRPVSPTNSTAFTLIVKNAKNTPMGRDKRFEAPFNSLYWPFNVEPCFGGENHTDVYHFYSLLDSWFGSVVYSTKYNGISFDCAVNENPFGACCIKDPYPPIKDIAEIKASGLGTVVRNTSGKLYSWGALFSAITTPFFVGLTFTKVSMGFNYICGVYEPLGGITCNGIAAYNNLSAPDVTGIIDITSGVQHNLALKSDGTVVAWGMNTFGQSNVPAGLSNVVKIAAGYEHSYALTANGGITCWGRNNFGQCNIPTGISFSDIVAYTNGGVGIATRGSTVYAWGEAPISNSVPVGLTAIEISSCATYPVEGPQSMFALARKQTGQVVAWGYNSPSGYTAVPAGLSASKIAAGGIHAAAVMNDRIIMWGRALEGQGQLTPPPGPCGITCIQTVYEQCNNLNSIWWGEGSICGLVNCGITAPCCAKVGCDSAVGAQSICNEGITFEDCLCGRAPNTPVNAAITFHEDKTSCEGLCETITCPSYGSCCTGGQCIDNPPTTLSDCNALNGKFNDSQLCAALPQNACSLGRCCILDKTNISNSTCRDNVLSQDCFTLDSNKITNWKVDGDCTIDKCFLTGACCTAAGGDDYCQDDTYALPIDLATYYGDLINPASHPICTIGLNGSFVGDGQVCTPDSCDVPNPDCPAASTMGTCVTRNCPGNGSFYTYYTSLANCRIPVEYPPGNFYNPRRFYANVTPNTTGKCCYVQQIGDIQKEFCENTTLELCSYKNPDEIGCGSIVELRMSWFEQQICSPNSCQYPDLHVLPNCNEPPFSPPPNDVIEVPVEEEGDGGIGPLDAIAFGSFIPNETEVLGNDTGSCCPASESTMTSGLPKTASIHISKADWFGYGITSTVDSENNESPIKFNIMLYTKDLSYRDSFGDKINTVIWGQTDENCAWGPNVEKTDRGFYLINDIKAHGKEYIYYKDEGYVGLTSINYSTEFLYDKSFNKQPSVQFTDKLGSLVNSDDSTFSNNGAWRRNWGLYNTMRLIGADNAGYALNNPVKNINYNLPEDWTASRLIDKINREVPFNDMFSSWYIPSLDEMAFICKNLDKLQGTFYDNIEGDYWTSTGAFDENTDEGIKFGPDDIAQTGSKAWAFSITRKTSSSPGEFPFDIKIRKENRNAKLKIRPIRIYFDAGASIPRKGTEEYKMWRLPPTKWIDDKINKGT